MFARIDQATLRAWCWLYLLAAVAAVLMHGLIPFFSTRTVSVAWDMWQHGSWILPLDNGVPYSHKTPLLYWLIHAGWAVGGVSDVWPRLLMVLLSGLNLWLLARLARQLFPARPMVATLAPMVLGGSFFYFLYALQVMFDVLLSAGVLLALIGLTRRRDGVFHPSNALIVAGLTLGLYAKGPVALLHVAAPLLLAPWWLAQARAAPGRWYARVALWIVAAAALFALWVVPVVMLGGEAFKQELLVTQTAGRVVEAFDHAKPLWWYLMVLPLLWFPFWAWASAWRAVGAFDPRDAGFRFLACWLVPTFIAFSLISGKQAYYLIPWLAGAALALAALIDRRDHGQPAHSGLGTAAMGLGLVGLAVIALPWLAASGALRSKFVLDFASAGPWFGIGIVALAASLCWPAVDRRHGLARLATAGLLATAALHVQFGISAWPRYDLRPAAALIAAEAAKGTTIANRGVYEAQFNFLARLRDPVVEIDYLRGPDFARANPDALVVDYVRARRPDDWPGPRPLHIQSFRGQYLELWRAGDWLAADQAGGPPQFARPAGE